MLIEVGLEQNQNKTLVHSFSAVRYSIYIYFKRRVSNSICIDIIENAPFSRRIDSGIFAFESVPILYPSIPLELIRSAFNELEDKI